MKVLRNGRGAGSIKNSVLTLGNFDGLHIGHRKVIQKVVDRASRLACPSVVYTFDPHPLKVVSPQKSPPLILDLEDKIRHIEELGVDFLVLARFTRGFAERHHDEFVREALVKKFSPVEVWVGHDFSFGKGRTGTVEHLKELGAGFGFSTHVIPPYKKLGAVVSSSRIRGLIISGMVKEAAVLLGRGYTVKGRVVKGAQVGSLLGFPTANLTVSSEIIPGDGVYAAWATLDGKRHPAVLNIGSAPTFAGRGRCVEVHMLDFDGRIYGRRLEVSFVARLRSEAAFATPAALAAQIGKDAARARKILKSCSGGLHC